MPSDPNVEESFQSNPLSAEVEDRTLELHDERLDRHRVSLHKMKDRLCTLERLVLKGSPSDLSSISISPVREGDNSHVIISENSDVGSEGSNDQRYGSGQNTCDEPDGRGREVDENTREPGDRTPDDENTQTGYEPAAE
ncbi:hypothetical protein AAVH_13866, partial [Aphelenchoides avenae]